MYPDIEMSPILHSEKGRGGGKKAMSWKKKKPRETRSSGAQWDGSRVWLIYLLDVYLMRRYEHFYWVDPWHARSGYVSQLSLVKKWPGRKKPATLLRPRLDHEWMDKQPKTDGWTKLPSDSSGHVAWWSKCLDKSRRLFYQYYWCLLLMSHMFYFTKVCCWAGVSRRRT